MAARSKYPPALILRTLVAWLVTLLLFFPLAWLIMTAFKTELQAIAVPSLLWFTPTLDNFREVQERSDYLLYARNSLITSVVSTVLGLLIAAPAAYSMAFFKGRHTRNILMWMLSTKMMPAVGALVPIYVLAQRSGLLDTRTGLIVIFMLSNLPIMVWMLYSHFKDIPHEILEAAHGWRQPVARVLPRDHAAGLGGLGLHRLVVPGVELERGLLEPEPEFGQSRHTGNLDCQLLQPRGPVLGQAVCCVADGDCTHRRLWLVQPEAACARADLWCGQVNLCLYPSFD